MILSLISLFFETFFPDISVPEFYYRLSLSENVTNQTEYVIKSHEIKDKKIIIVSDFHHCSKFVPKEAVKYTVKQLKYLISAENATNIFILGDLVQGTCPTINNTFNKLFKHLNMLNISITILGGNHDRQFLSNYNCSYPNIHILKESQVRVYSNPNIILAHDFLYNFRVRGKFVSAYITFLRERMNIDNETIMVIGHTHTPYVSQHNKSYSVGQFSVDERSFMYAVLATDRNACPTIQLKEHQYTPNIDL